MAPRGLYRLAAAFDRRKRRLERAMESDRAAAFAIVARHRLCERAVTAVLAYLAFLFVTGAVGYFYPVDNTHVAVVVGTLYAAETIPKLVRDRRRYHHERQRMEFLGALRRAADPSGAEGRA